MGEGRCAAQGDQPVMNGFVRVTAMQLQDRDRELRRQQRRIAQNREFLDDKPDVAVSVHQSLDLVIGLAAIPAAIIHEFDHRDIAVRVATDPIVFIHKQRIRLGHDQHLVAFQRGDVFAFLQDAHRFDQNFGVFQKIGADFGTQGLTLGFGHVFCQSRQGGKAKDQAKGKTGHKGSFKSPTGRAGRKKRRREKDRA